MSEENINKTGTQLRVLVAPLDWGLGHATRCIPIIQALLQQNITVLLAAEGAVATLLRQEFPDLTILALKGYRITYSSHKFLFLAKIILQIPKITAIARFEKNWLKQIVRRYKIDAVISDNRPGMYNASINSVYLTHQLYIETGNVFLNKIARKIHYHFINRFNECWVPDAPGSMNLAGKLSHPQTLPKIPVKYLGILSRFKKYKPEVENDLLIILSGPEPQRTLFEKTLATQLINVNKKVVMVRGLPGAKKELKVDNKNVVIFNHLSSQKLSLLIQQSVLVLARAGYSTIMDLASLQQKAILVPTPGQTEQQYLGVYLKKKKFFFVASQLNFHLVNVLQQAEQFSFVPFNVEATDLVKIIGDFLKRLKITSIQ